jgi:hypothetical protein
LPPSGTWRSAATSCYPEVALEAARGPHRLGVIGGGQGHDPGAGHRRCGVLHDRGQIGQGREVEDEDLEPFTVHDVQPGVAVPVDADDGQVLFVFKEEPQPFRDCLMVVD